jgi:Helix-turn-helix domain
MNMQTASNDKPSYFVSHVAPALIQDPGLSMKAKMVACSLLMHYNRRSGLCYPTESTMAAELGTKERTIIRALAELKTCSLVAWESRKAPRGQAKGQGNLYDLTGLFALCSQPIRNSSEVTKTTGREVTKMTGRSVENRPIEQNKRNSDNHKSLSLNRKSCSEREQGSPEPLTDSHCIGSLDKPKTDGEVTKTTPRPAQTAQASAPKRRFTAAQALENRMAPDGTSFYEGVADGDAWLEATRTLKRVGGEPFNPRALQKLIEAHGEERVWFHAKWYPLRLASRKTPPDKAAPFFIKCVEEDYPVEPKWLDLVFSRIKHGCFTEEQRAEIPASHSSPVAWARWMNSLEDGSLDDVPDDVRVSLHEAINRRDLDAIFALHDEGDAPTPDRTVGGELPSNTSDEVEEAFGF